MSKEKWKGKTMSDEQNNKEVLPGAEVRAAFDTMAALPDDIAQVLPNYKARNDAGESFEDMAVQVERMNDKRLAAVLRSMHAGSDPEERKAAPKGRAAGNKSVAASEGKAE
jgi:hypothetical protein